MFRQFCRFILIAVALVAAPLAQAQLVIPGGGSSGATPGGSSGQLQFNNAGVFGGASGTSWDDTNRRLTIGNAGATQSLIVTFSELKFNRAGTSYVSNGNAEGSVKIGIGSDADGITVNSDKTVSFFSTLSGSGATVTTSTPLLDLSQTWNAGAVAFSALKLNVTDTASAAGSLLLDLRVGGASKFNVNKNGQLTANYGVINNTLALRTNSAAIMMGVGDDTGISRLGAASLAIGNGTAGDFSGSLKLYGINVNGNLSFISNGFMDTISDGIFRFRNNAATSGGTVDVSTDATFKFRNRTNGADAAITAATVKTAGYTVATLPAGATGMRAHVTDQLTACPAISGTFTGGGNVVCAAFYNGTAWVFQ